MFDEVPKQTFTLREEEVLRFWNEKKIFEQSITAREKAPYFSFYDGPPFATGLPHYGHLLAGTIKDVVLRYKTMKGFAVARRFGWDCHGLPVEQEIEKAFQLSGAPAIEEFGIARFNEECRKIVFRYTEEWKTTVQRMGRWVDFSKTFHTMDKTFMESVWAVFKTLHDKGLVYEGYKVMPFSAKLGTPLSNFEASENYKEVDDPSLTVTLSLLEDPETHLLVWTTTPWTLVSNLAAVVGAGIEYVKVRDKGANKNFVLAKERLGVYYKDPLDYVVLDSFKGSALEGKKYQPLFPYFSERASEGAFRVIAAEFVSTEDGTGIVHAAPAFGEADFYACKQAGIEPVCPVNRNGLFTEEIPEYEGLFVKDADKDIIKRLRAAGKVAQAGTIHHRYPFCWRSDTPLIYRLMNTWFVAVEKFKDRVLAANEQIHWVPEHIKAGRFGKWLEGARDWAISRNRYWGTPIPIWRADDGEVVVIGSIAELEELTQTKVTDLHRHFIDDLTFTKNGKVFRRILEVFDCWFESGSMPYAQNHYPFENKQFVEETFPADFIAEGVDQTRGWFYTLTVLAAALFDKPAFKNVVVNGIILAEDGNKMSKRLKNYPDPQEVIQKHGADAIRLYMLHSPAVRADDLRFSEEGIRLVLRQVLIPLWSAYSGFFLTYARMYNWKPTKTIARPKETIDKWLISLLHKLAHDVQEAMDAYDLSRAVEPLVGFVEQLTNWYIRRCRRRFWSEEATSDRDEAFSTLYIVLLELSKLIAPVVPFLSDAIYRNLRMEGMPVSVHLCDFTTYHPELRDEPLERAMAALQETASLGHALRKEYKIKVRQPLPAVHVASSNPETIRFLKEQQQLIADELHVKKVIFHRDEKDFVTLVAKPNFRVLGKKVGPLMKAVQQEVLGLSVEQLAVLMAKQNVAITVEGKVITLTPEDVEVHREVKEGLVAAVSSSLAIALDTALTDELIEEGLARELVNKISTMRRDAEFEVSDRILLKLQTTDRVRQCFQTHGELIKGEVLATEVAFGECAGTEWDLNGELTTIAITKITK